MKQPLTFLPFEWRRQINSDEWYAHCCPELKSMELYDLVIAMEVRGQERMEQHAKRVFSQKLKQLRDELNDIEF